MLKKSMITFCVIVFALLKSVYGTDTANNLNTLEKCFDRYYPNLKTEYASSKEEKLLSDTVVELKAITKTNPEAYDALVNYGRVCVYANNLDKPDAWNECDKTLRKAIKINPGKWEAYYYLGDLYVHSPGHQEEGISMLSNALKFGQQQVNPKALLFLSEGYAVSEPSQLSQAIQSLNEYKSMKGDDSYAKYLDVLFW